MWLTSCFYLPFLRRQVSLSALLWLADRFHRAGQGSGQECLTNSALVRVQPMMLQG